MKLDSFKELLLKKADGDSILQTLIKYSSDEIIANKVIEALEKMAISDINRTRPTVIGTQFGRRMRHHPHLPEQMRHAIGHHFSHASAAHKAGNEKLANKHLHNALRIMHITDVAEKAQHDTGKTHAVPIKIHAPKIDPWERTFKEQKYGDPEHAHKIAPGGSKADKYTANDFVNVNKGLPIIHRRADLSFLLGAPSSKANPRHYQNQQKSTGQIHTGAYPGHEVKINGKHVPIDSDIMSTNEFVPHSFDEHPIMNHYTKHDLGAYEDAMDQYAEGDHDYEADMEKLKLENPDRFNLLSSGQKADRHVFDHINSNPDFQHLDTTKLPVNQPKDDWDGISAPPPNSPKQSNPQKNVPKLRARIQRDMANQGTPRQKIGEGVDTSQLPDNIKALLNKKPEGDK